MSDENKTSPDQEEIRRRAYEIYSARGRADGKALDDWLAAEQELSFGASRRAVNTSR